ncbi:hypothetical protein [Azospirillum sp. SYSU D00513]|uniref:hypothetical protein n=1 Tax=Azospirillum sp. SYSU D00513 TaxID=2812561 RepID=UPI001A966C78|nr:hypothetical protein [Azospirillum sp. SYSU D00513]
MQTLAGTAAVATAVFAAAFAVFYVLVLVNNIMGERFERSLHAGRRPGSGLPGAGRPAGRLQAVRQSLHGFPWFAALLPCL